jgi:hypothetical protein
MGCNARKTNNITTNTGILSISIDDNLADVGDFQSLATLFEWYRVNAIKVLYIPANISDTSTHFRAGYIIHDTNSQAAPPTTSVEALIKYENCKVVNMQRKWKYYRKLYRRINGPNFDNRGYINVANPEATQIILVASVFT